MVVTQGYTNIKYGVNGIELLEEGLSPQDALSKILKKDLENDRRQVAMMDWNGRKVSFTGKDTPKWHGEVVGENYVVLGNLIRGEDVLEEMAEALEESSKNLIKRLIGALEKGQMAGGDKRGELSAATVVVGAENTKVKAEVNYHRNPIQVLKRKVEAQL